MKKITLILSFLFIIASLHAQDYLISFNGSGASTTTETITIENLTQGKSITMNGNEVLHLMATISGLDPIVISENALNIYPNPANGNSTIDFVASASGIAILELFDITGKSVGSVQNSLTAGTHSYQINNLQSGIYLLRILSQAYNYTGKLISKGYSGSNVKISYIGNSLIPGTTMKLKSANTEILMQYTTGDRLKITASSGNYSTVITDIPTQNKTITFPFVPCTDADGNNYPVVQIGTQIWMAENLQTTRYNDGTSIPNVTDKSEWYALTSDAYCWYNNDVSNKIPYGALYNWNAVNTEKLAPKGWHVPSKAEWETLISYLGGGIYGGKIKVSGFNYWIGDNVEGSNETGFTAVPGGSRDSGFFEGFGYSSLWWSNEFTDAIYMFLVNSNGVATHNGYKSDGYSVRCLKGDLLVPTINTSDVTNITTTTAAGVGIMISNGGSKIISSGGCWNTTGNPTKADNASKSISSNGNFGFLINNLNPNTKYFVKAYATNGVGTTYGNEVSFTTGEKTTLPTVTTKEITSISQTSANTGGIVTFNGFADVTARGVCWSTIENPTITDNKTSDWVGIGSFDSGISGLTDNTTYFCRAYATNSAGTGYGNQISFTTPAATGIVTDIDGNVYHTVTIGTQVWMIENLKTTKFNDGTDIPNVTDNSAWSNLKTPGYCWYNNDISNKNPYGGLYNWYAVNTKNLSPKGWHVPTKAEWSTLRSFVDGDYKLIESGTTHWQYNSASTNETGFTALPGGNRLGISASMSGQFLGLGYGGNFWTSSLAGTDGFSSSGYSTSFTYYSISEWATDLVEGFSVRCVKD